MSRDLMYDEKAIAEDIYSNGFTEGYFNFRQGILVAKYMRHELGFGDTKIKTKLKNFCVENDKNFYYPPNIGRVKKMVSLSRKPFVNTMSPVIIRQKEIERLNSVQDYRKKKLLFAILVLSKINNNRYLRMYDWNSIRRAIHSRITNKKIAVLIKEFYDTGFLDIVSFGHSLLFYDDESSPVVEITAKTIYDLNRVFVEVFGEDIFNCQVCGNPTVRKSHNQKRCKSCSEKVRRERKTVLERKYRQKKKVVVDILPSE